VFGCDHFVERRWQLGQIGNPNWHNDLPIDSRVGLTIHGDGYQKLEMGRDIDGEADLPLAQEVADGVDAGWFDRVDAARLSGFAGRKQRLPETCKVCQYKPFCHGGCPKHRSAGGELPEPTILCGAYKVFFGHALERMEWLAGYLRRGEQPPSSDPGAGKLRKKERLSDVRKASKAGGSAGGSGRRSRVSAGSDA